jgi:hypothetical protein
MQLITTITAIYPDKRWLFFIWFITNWLNCIVEFMNFDECIGNRKFINNFELGR